jgi:hypothetical protein
MALLWWRTLDDRATALAAAQASQDELAQVLDQLRWRLESLEAQNRTLGPLLESALFPAEAPFSAERIRPRAAAGPSLGLSGKPASKPSSEEDDPAAGMEQALGRSEHLRGIAIANDRPSTLGTPSASLNPEPSAPPDRELEAAAEREEAEEHELHVAFNQLLRDAGLTEYRMLQARPFGEPGQGLRDVVLALRNVRGTGAGSVVCQQLTLVYDPPGSQRARLVLDGAQAIRDAMKTAYPDDRLEIEIPGKLPPSWLADPLPELFGLERGDPGFIGSVRRPQENILLEEYNSVLEAEHHVALRIREIGAEVDESLQAVVFDLEFDGRGHPTKSVVAEHAWWVLDASRASVELHCRGGEMVMKGKRRPLYKGIFRLTLRNIDPGRWTQLGSVRIPPSPPVAEVAEPESTAGS